MTQPPNSPPPNNQPPGLPTAGVQMQYTCNPNQDGVTFHMIIAFPGLIQMIIPAIPYQAVPVLIQQLKNVQERAPRVVVPNVRPGGPIKAS